jgi:quinol monooxygenase YgiN
MSTFVDTRGVLIAGSQPESFSAPFVADHSPRYKDDASVLSITLLGLLKLCCSGKRIVSRQRRRNIMVTLTAKLTVKAGKEQEFEQTMKKVVPEVRKEAGNRAYTMCKAKDNPQVFMFYEEYVDDDAFKAHRKHLGELGVNLAALLDGAPVLEFYEKIAS